MTLEEQLKVEILRQYHSIREFSSAVHLSNSTVDSVLRRGIRNSSIETIFPIFTVLNLDVESIKFGQLKALSRSPLDDDEAALMQQFEPTHDALTLARDYDRLDQWGQKMLRAVADVELERMEAENRKQDK